MKYATAAAATLGNGASTKKAIGRKESTALVTYPAALSRRHQSSFFVGGSGTR